MARSERGLRNMTDGSPAEHIFYFALPLLAGSFLQQLYNMVDSWVVGNYVGDAALAAVGVGFPVIFMFTSLFMGISNGGTVVIAQYYGAGKLDRVRDAVDTIYTAFMAAALPVTVLALLLVKPLLFVLRVESGAYHEAWVYLMIVCAGLVGTIGYNINAGILGGLGNSRTTLLFLAISSLMNIALDLALVLAAGMGVAGVALGTILSQAFSWLFGLFYINRRYPDIAIRPFCRRFDRTLFRQIMEIGLLDLAGIHRRSQRRVDGQLSQNGQMLLCGSLFNAALAEDGVAFAAVGTLVVAVILYQTQDGNGHHVGHIHRLGNDHGHQLLGGGDHHDAVNGQRLEHRQGYVAGSRGHIHKQVVYVAPRHIGPELLDHVGNDRSPPDNRVGLMLHEHIQGDHLDPSGGHRGVHPNIVAVGLLVDIKGSRD